MTRLKNIHPGEILQEEFLIPMGISAYRLAKETFIPQTRISEIIKGNRRITADTALRFSRFFGNSPKFWLGLQDDFDLEEEIDLIGKEISSIQQLAEVEIEYTKKAAAGNTKMTKGRIRKTGNKSKVKTTRSVAKRK